MKRLLFSLLLNCIVLVVIAHSPLAFKYQAVVRNTSGDILANKVVSFRISILSGSPAGTSVYSETHVGKTTNSYGLVDLEIGNGTPVTGTFSSIVWASSTYYVKVEIDPVGGTAYTAMGTSQLLSVPYALYANDVKNRDDADADATNELQKLSISGTVLSLDKNGGSVTLPSSGSGGDNWGTDYVRTDATLSGQGTVAAPLKIAQQAAALGQVLKWNGSTWVPGNEEAGGLTLPFSGTTDSAGSGFLVTNNGGNALRGITNSPTGSAIYGNANSTSGKNYGVLGSTSSPEGYGVMGYAGSTSGNPTAVSGEAVSGFGIYGKSPLVAIYGTATAVTGNSSGVRGFSTSTTGSGVNGIAVSPTGENYGVKGESSSSLGKGVYGAVTASTGSTHGVYGWTGSSSGTGVYGMAEAETGVTYGVFGKVNSVDGFSGFFHGGKFHVNGKMGIGTENPTAQLDVRGDVRITGGNPGEGKVLTSDALGLASWKSPGGGLTLPYSGSVSTTGDQAFSIWNTGTGNGIFTRASSGNGLVSQSNGGVKTSGIMGLAYGTGDNYGVSGNSNSPSGTGVSGSASSLTGTTIGVSGQVISPDGYSGYFEGGKFYISGNTGIGVTAPSAKLDINGQVKIRGGSPGSGKALISDANGLAGWQSIAPWLHNGTDIYLFNGNLGLGHTNPQARLDVSASQGPNIIIRDSDGGGGRPGIQFVNNDVHFIGSDDTSTEIFGFYSGYGNNRSNAARLNIHGPASNNWGKYISLTYDGNHGRISTDAGYLVLEPSGQRVGIGTDAPTQNLDINGTARVRVMNTGTSAGTVYRTADGTLITGASDARLKENIKSIENSLDKVIRLNGVTYAWKSDPDKRQNIGFIAQDFEKVLPELVFTNENDGFKGINYAEVTAVLVEAIKELKADNDRLKMENKSYSIELSQAKEKFESMNSRLELIETILNK